MPSHWRELLFLLQRRNTPDNPLVYSQQWNCKSSPPESSSEVESSSMTSPRPVAAFEVDVDVPPLRLIVAPEVPVAAVVAALRFVPPPLLTLPFTEGGMAEEDGDGDWDGWIDVGL